MGRKVEVYKSEKSKHDTYFTQEWRQLYPEKKQAQIVINTLIARGELTKQPCEICGNPKAHGHHDDYSKPLEIRWLCASHHQQYHARKRKEERCEQPSA